LPDERHVLDALLERPFDGRDELRHQALTASVTGLCCNCGCPSVALAVDRSTPPSPATGPVADGFGLDVEGNIVCVGLFVDPEGYMHEIDVSAVGTDIDGRTTHGAHGWPRPDTFRLAPSASGSRLFEVSNLFDLWPTEPRHRADGDRHDVAQPRLDRGRRPERTAQLLAGLVVGVLVAAVLVRRNRVRV
jgi:hypothetical protein